MFLPKTYYTTCLSEGTYVMVRITISILYYIPTYYIIQLLLYEGFYVLTATSHVPTGYTVVYVILKFIIVLIY